MFTQIPLYSVNDAADALETYPLLVKNLLHRNPQIIRRRISGVTILGDESLAQLRPLVDAHKNRPRMSHPVEMTA